MAAEALARALPWLASPDQLEWIVVYTKALVALFASAVQSMWRRAGSHWPGHPGN